LANADTGLHRHQNHAHNAHRPRSSRNLTDPWCAPDAVATVGLLESQPKSRNVVPGSVFFTIDLRHPSDDVVAAMEAEDAATAGTHCC
jgi:acetylornithine deacetylase/succinyl-diaminopimelate desuccinylase-like protein